MSATLMDEPRSIWRPPRDTTNASNSYCRAVTFHQSQQIGETAINACCKARGTMYFCIFYCTGIWSGVLRTRYFENLIPCGLTHIIQGMTYFSQRRSLDCSKVGSFKTHNSSLIIIQGLLRLKIHLNCMTSLFTLVPYYLISTFKKNQFIRR